MNRSVEILNTAATLVGGDRHKTHGSKWDNHQNIANLWTAYIRNEFERIGVEWRDEMAFTPGDVAAMMVLLKVARTQAGSFNLDDATDAAGYAAIMGELLEIQADGAVDARVNSVSK